MNILFEQQEILADLSFVPRLSIISANVLMTNEQ